MSVLVFRISPGISDDYRIPLMGRISIFLTLALPGHRLILRINPGAQENRGYFYRDGMTFSPGRLWRGIFPGTVSEVMKRMLERLDELRDRWNALPRWKQVAAIALALVLLFAGFLLVRSPGRGKVEVITAGEVEEGREPEEIVVYVSGAVKSPGIQRLPAGSRVADALERAGGPLPEADLEGLNLAQKLTDGQRIHVPRRGQLSPGSTKSDRVNINTAPASELEKLPGIGPTLASRIVEYREENGPFRRLEDLKKVRGIGESKLRELRDRVEI